MDLPPMDGKVVLVTGANSGIGRETARSLAALGARVVLAVRNADAGEEARRRIAEETGNHALEVLRVDLADLRDVDRFADHFLATHDRLDVLVNNAGIHTAVREETPDGHERTFATNHLGPFALTRRLQGLLVKSAPSRVVTVASEAHRFAAIRWDDPMMTRWWSGLYAYAQSKLANILFSNELARRLSGTGVTSNAVHPGSVRTRWARRPDSGLFRHAARLSTPFLRSPEEGARTSLHAAASPEVADVTGAYFRNARPATPSRRARDPDAARRLWDLSEGLIDEARARRG